MQWQLWPEVRPSIWQSRFVNVIFLRHFTEAALGLRWSKVTSYIFSQNSRVQMLTMSKCKTKRREMKWWIGSTSPWTHLVFCLLIVTILTWCHYETVWNEQDSEFAASLQQHLHLDMTQLLGLPRKNNIQVRMLASACQHESHVTTTMALILPEVHLTLRCESVWIDVIVSSPVSGDATRCVALWVNVFYQPRVIKVKYKPF